MIEIILPQDGVEGLCVAYDSDGNALPVPARLVFQPFFHRPDAIANVAFLRVTATDDWEETEPEELQKLVIQQPGTTGKLRFTDRSAHVPPKFIRDHRKAASSAAAAKPPRPRRPTPVSLTEEE